MPIATASVAAARIVGRDRTTPAFASAKIGRITKLVHGNSACSTRASGETDSRESHARRIHDGASASGGSGWSVVSSAMRLASTLTAFGRWKGVAGASSPSTTPAIVGWMPASKVAYQITTPSTT